MKHRERREEPPSRKPLAAQSDAILPFFDGRTIPTGSNAGLVYDRFPSLWNENAHESPQWDPKFAPKRRMSFRAQFVHTFCEDYGQISLDGGGHRALLRAQHKRLERVRARMLQAVGIATVPYGYFEAPLVGRFVTGLGAAHPLGNGFSLSHGGVPVILGSSLKGVARAAATRALPKLIQEHSEWGLKEDKSGSVLVRIFGPEHSAERMTQGTVTFLDGLPAEWPRLAPDVLTPHHPDYYQKDSIPGDWQAPSPVFFVTVVDTVYVFRLCPAPHFGAKIGNRMTPATDLAIAHACLMWGLEHLGMGAKTSAGYGRLAATRSSVTSTTIEDLRIPVEVLTPIFGGGATSTENDPNAAIRPPAIRGALRWWFRAAMGALLPPGPSTGGQDEGLEQLRILEAILFGWAGRAPYHPRHDKNGGKKRPLEETTGRSAVDVLPPEGFWRLEVQRAGQAFSGTAYTQYGIFDQVKGVAGTKTRTRKAVPSGTSLTLVFKLRGEEEERNRLRPLLLSALWLWLNFGNIGARSRRGWGGLVPTGEPTSSHGDLKWKGPSFVHGQNTAAALRSWLVREAGNVLGVVYAKSRKLLEQEADTSSLRWEPEGRQDYSTLKEFRVVAVPPKLDDCTLWGRESFDQPEQILEVLGALLSAYRNVQKRRNRGARPFSDGPALKHWTERPTVVPRTIERAAFGLPLTFRFKKHPQVDVQGQQHDRRASPLMFKVHRLTSGQYAGIVSHMNGMLLAEGEELRIKTSTLKAFVSPPDQSSVIAFLTFVGNGGKD